MRGRWLRVGVLVSVLLAGVPSGPVAAETKLVVASPQAQLLDTGLIFLVAKEKGFFKEAGLDVETVIVSARTSRPWCRGASRLRWPPAPSRS